MLFFLTSVLGAASDMSTCELDQKRGPVIYLLAQSGIPCTFSSPKGAYSFAGLSLTRALLVGRPSAGDTMMFTVVVCCLSAQAVSLQAFGGPFGAPWSKCAQPSVLYHTAVDEGSSTCIWSATRQLSHDMIHIVSVEADTCQQGRNDILAAGVLPSQ